MLKEEWASYARRRARAVEVALLSYLGRLEAIKNRSLSDGAGPFELSRERASSLALGREKYLSIYL